MLYRALTDLRIGATLYPARSILPERLFSAHTRAQLVAQKRIAPVSGPPIAAIPMFEPYLDALLAAGILDVCDLLEVDTSSVPGVPLDVLKSHALALIKQPCENCRVGQ